MSNVYDPRLRELETLKAQLARAEFDLRRKDCSTCHGSGEFQDSTDGGIWVRCHCWANRVDEIKRVSEAQVRELRASLTLFRKLLWLRHGCGIAPLYGDDGEMQCAKCGIDFLRATPETISDIWKRLNEAALRSAPPSGPKYAFEGKVNLRNTGGEGYEIVANSAKQAPYDKTDDWEERKDLAAQVPAAAAQPSASVPLVEGADVPFNSAVGTYRESPQDSPSRSEWISAEERLPDSKSPVLVYVGALPIFVAFYRDGVWLDQDSIYEDPWDRKPLASSVTHWQPLPAPPSPAREPEIVVPALPNKPIDYPVKYRNDEPARELEIHQPTYEAPEIFRQRLRDGEKEKAE